MFLSFTFLIKKQNIKSFFYNYFGFNKQQRGGLLTLCVICFALTIVRFAYPSFIKAEPIVIQNLPLIEKKLDSAEQNNPHYKKHRPGNFASGKFFVFDPNTITFDELLTLGFSEKMAGIFLKFRNKGFVFKQKEDLKKVFGISDNFYNKLAAYVLIKNPDALPDKSETRPVNESSVKNNKIKNTELNSADSLALLEINGIGPSFVKRILKYRGMLGGFAKPEQLKEVYGFSDEIYDKIKSQVSVNAALIKKINLATDDFKTVNRHPYITYELCKSIFDWKRKTNITRDNIAGILNDEVLYQKLIPYLEF